MVSDRLIERPIPATPMKVNAITDNAITATPAPVSQPTPARTEQTRTVPATPSEKEHPQHIIQQLQASIEIGKLRMQQFEQALTERDEALQQAQQKENDLLQQTQKTEEMNKKLKVHMSFSILLCYGDLSCIVYRLYGSVG